MESSPSAVRPQEVRDALEHLYENVVLAQGALAGALPDIAVQTDLELRAQLLRRTLLSAIERLRPVRSTSFTDHSARSYHVLSLRYLEEMTVKQVADELGVGERQAYRELRRAEAELAKVLTTYSSGRAPERSEEEAWEAELRQVVSHPRRLDLGAVLRQVLQAVTILARRRSVSLRTKLAALPAISADEGLLRQVLVQALSMALQVCDCAGVELRAGEDGGEVCIQVRFRSAASLPDDLLRPLHGLAESQHLGWHLETAGEDITLGLRVKVEEPRLVLVVEDNQAAAELYRRYLADSPGWRMVNVPDPRLTVEMARRMKPAVIVLDLMMPQQDGWTILQTLHTQPETRDMPVVVCSVFHDPGLAQALGAAACLKKPVSRMELLTALERCQAQPSSPISPAPATA
ncbi:MAG: response regulator [Anaerolineae bacterium]|nr:response regulator [Anaerolineae bacterium]